MAPITIGIIGGSASGKTTYLGALGIAVMLEPAGEWIIVGQNPASIEFLARTKNSLLRREFPPTSVGIEEYTYTVTGTLTPERLRRAYASLQLNPDTMTRVLSWIRVAQSCSFTMAVEDYSGAEMLYYDLEDDFWKYLASCDGLIYLFDPFLETEPLPNYTYIDKAATCIYIHCQRDNRLIENRLPHYIAVAITKSDEPEIAQVMRHYPKPEEAFQKIADQLTIPTIRHYFSPRRTSYYFVSSIGQYKNPITKIVDPNDCYNVIETEAGRRLRGAPNPMNVFEPLLWLYGNIVRNS